MYKTFWRETVNKNLEIYDKKHPGELDLHPTPRKKSGLKRGADRQAPTGTQLSKINDKKSKKMRSMECSV